ncbi:MAG: phosphoribosylglycinamide formyltransferase [Gammaproteobacteria bacterium]
MPAAMPVVIMISGRGSNLRAIIDAIDNKLLAVRIVAVISNNAKALGLEYARLANIDIRCFNQGDYSDRESFDLAIQKGIDHYAPELVILAGYMRILSVAFVHHFQGRLMNIHPSLLPEFPGLHTHQRAIEAGVTTHGASIHFVTEELDGGPVVLQTRVDVRKIDTAETLAARVLVKEHSLYITAIRWYAEGRLVLKNDNAMLDGKKLDEPIQLDNPE